jgi:hypothetical protein
MEIERPSAESISIRERKRTRAPLIGLRTLFLQFQVSPSDSLLTFSQFIELSSENQNMDEKELENLARQRLNSAQNLLPLIEARLRGAGIQLLSQEEWLAAQENSHLYIWINVGTRKKDASFYVVFHLYQKAQLVGDPAIIFTAKTWEYKSGERWYSEGDQATRKKTDMLKAEVENAMESFLYDYNLVNDKL